jgi:hypothetical protein
VPDDKPAEITSLEEVSGGIYGFIAWMWTQPQGLSRNTVCEAFNLDGRTPKPDLTPVEIIGALKYAVPPENLHFQTNTQGKHLMTNEVLKRAGYYPERGKVGGGHAVDSLRHALTYVVKTLKHKPTISRLYPQEA